MPIPSLRLTDANSRPERPDGDYVLYWMIAHRRLGWNFALEHAVQQAQRLGKPLLIFEPLRIRYRWASDRLHRFVIEGMRDHATALGRVDQGPETIRGVAYYPYVEPAPGRGTPLLQRLAERACLVVTDDYPCFFLPHMVDAVRERLPVKMQQVDSNGLVPLRMPDRTFTVAHSYRRWMQKHILDLLHELPSPQPLQRLKLPAFPGLGEEILKRWPVADFTALLDQDGLSRLAIDHQVKPVAAQPGGAHAASRRLANFLGERIPVYDEQRNDPDAHATSGLSPYLHFGHLSAHEVVHRLLQSENWTPDQAAPANGKNTGFWNTSASSEAFLDQMLTWREIGFNLCHREPQRFDRYESLPDWAQKSLAAHQKDRRPVVYSLETLEQAATGDEVWNAAQRELVQTGSMQNYLRMLWGKNVLAWTETPQQALEYLIELNNKYALDGRDPNSYSGIFWVFGRYDRAWGPTRPIFGNVRYMTSDSARRKLRMKRYLATYSQ